MSIDIKPGATLRCAAIGLFIIVLSLLYFFHYNDRHLNPPWDGYRIHDFHIYYDAAKKMKKDGNPYTFKKFSTSFTYSPSFLYLLESWIAPKHFDHAVIRWEIANYFFLVMIFLLLFLIIKKIRPQLESYFWVMLLSGALSFRYIDRTLNMGQVNLLILLCLMASLWFKLHGRSIMSGFCIAVIMLMKPHLVIYFWFFFLFIHRDIRLVAVSCLSFIALNALPALHYGIPHTTFLVQEWLKLLLQRGGGDVALLSAKNHSMLGVLSYVIPANTPSWIIFLLLYAAGFVALSIYFKRLSHDSAKSESIFLGFTAATLTTLVFSMHVIQEYFVLLMLPYAVWLAQIQTLFTKKTVFWMTLLFVLSLIKTYHLPLLITLILAYLLVTSIRQNRHV